MLRTNQVREIKIVDRGGGAEDLAFYRFVTSRSPVWYSMPLRVARLALQKGRWHWNGVEGPVVQLLPKSESIDLLTGKVEQEWDH